jgi:hypothetical protein
MAKLSWYTLGISNIIFLLSVFCIHFFMRSMLNADENFNVALLYNSLLIFGFSYFLEF